MFGLPVYKLSNAHSSTLLTSSTRKLFFELPELAITHQTFTFELLYQNHYM